MSHTLQSIYLTGLLLAAPGVAQTEGETPTTRWNPVLRVSVGGPEVARTALLPTNLGALLDEEGVEELWHALCRSVFRAAHAGEESAETRAIESAVDRYSGWIDADLSLDPGRSWDQPRGSVLIRSDGHTEMGAMLDAVRDATMRHFGVAPRALRLEGGTQVEVFGPLDGPGVTAPVELDGGDLAIFFGTSIDEDAVRGFAELGDSWAQRVALHRARERDRVFELELDLKQVAERYLEKIFVPKRHNDRNRWFGMNAWDRAHLSIGAAGSRVEVRSHIDFRHEDRGLFSALLPPIRTLPRLARTRGANFENGAHEFVTGHIDLERLYDIVLEAVTAWFGGGQTTDELEAQFAEDIGIDLRDELLARLGTGIAVLSGFETDGPRSDDEYVPFGDGVCVAFDLDDGESFDETFQKLGERDALSPGTPFESEGAKVLPIGIIDDGCYVALRGRTLYYAIGPRGLAAMRAHLGEPELDRG